VAAERILPTAARPASGMCAEQAADLRAACAGHITWAQYFRKWGGPAL
jgi:hypothetical protein